MLIRKDTSVYYVQKKRLALPVKVAGGLLGPTVVLLHSLPDNHTETAKPLLSVSGP